MSPWIPPDRRTRAGLLLLGVIVMLALIGPLFTPDPTATLAPPLSPPSWAHPLGTTGQGQDVLAQTLAGARLTLLVGFLAGLGSVLVGTAIGAIAGYAGGLLDDLLSLLTNVTLVLPGLPLAVVLATWLPPGPASLIFVLVCTGWAWNARVIRAEVLQMRRRDWVDAARLSGESPLRIVLVEILPNLRPLLAAALVGATIYNLGAQVGLEFLGLGDPGAVTWGTNLYWAANDGALLTRSWWTFVPTGAMVAAVGFALALINAGMSEGSSPGAPVDTPSEGLAAKEHAEDRPALPSPVLEVRDLRVRYGPIRVVDDVSLALGPGEILGLAGESGSGKSTVAHAVLRLLRAPAVISGGAITLEGHDVLSLGPEGLSRLRWQTGSIVLQNALEALNPVITVGSQLIDTLRAHPPFPDAKAARARAAELLSLVGLGEEHLDRWPHQLSGGQRQRVNIAQALALRPKLVLMDEPTTALDVVVQRELLQRVLELRDKLGFAVVFVTHDLPLLFDLADRVAVLYAGRLVELGPARAMRERPAHPYTQGLLRAMPPLDGPRRPLAGIKGHPPDPRSPLPGCRFAPRCPLATARCTIEVPSPRPVGPDWMAACHLLQRSAP